MTELHPAWKKKKKVVIGMLHLPALPGSPRSNSSLNQIRNLVRRDADALVRGGVDGLMMENFGDVPFYPACVPAHTIAQMAALAWTVRAEFDLPLGINVLRNDGVGALAVAHAAAADFIRVNVLCGARVADQGLIVGIAHDVLRERQILNAGNIRIFADVDVKHSAPLAERSIEDEVSDVIKRGLADAVVVSGAGTGKATDPEKVRRVTKAATPTPVFIGSGITVETVKQFLRVADGFIVGTSLKRNGAVNEPVELARVKALMQAVAG